MGYSDEEAFDEMVYDSMENKRLQSLEYQRNENYICEVCSSGNSAITSVNGILVCSEACHNMVLSGEYDGVHKE